MRKVRAVDRQPPSVEEMERYLDTHYPRQRPLATTPEALIAACAVGREAERVRMIRLAMSRPDED